MSEAKHTPGHLILEHVTDIVTVEGGVIMDVASVYCHAIDGRTEANAERMVACWNACQGIDTEDLKAGSVSIIHKLHDEAANLVLSQLDELLAQLEKIATSDHEAQFAALDMKGIARAAIAKATKVQT